MPLKRNAALVFCLLLLSGCKEHAAWNNPHQKERPGAVVRYATFAEKPKTLDPALSYSLDEAAFMMQIYEPPLQYHYLLRPYKLVPLTAASMPTVTYYAADGQTLSGGATGRRVAYSVYDIYIKPGTLFQPHPAFAKDAAGQYRYHHLTEKALSGVFKLSDFKYVGVRELTAADYVYEIKRLAWVNSPILGYMGHHIKGLVAYAKRLHDTASGQRYLDLREYPFEGAKVIDRYHYQVVVIGKYPQFKYWLAMPFFAPIPWEADYFYSQPGMKARNISFGWYPVGTGPYMLTVNNPNKEMVLSRNPSFHEEFYPSEGMLGDREKGLLADAGKLLPMIDKVIYSLDPETIPMWHKFLQGYYDQSGIASDNFEQAIQFDEKGRPELTPEMKARQIRLQTTTSPAVFYIGFNMNDKVVGGAGLRARKLRQAISIALDMGEFVSIFANGRGTVAQGPIPPGLFGYRGGKAGMDPVVYEWREGAAHRKSIAVAKKLLAAAGYPNGRNRKTGRPLILYFDTTISGAADDKARFDWMRKQFSKLGVQLQIRSTQYNRYQEKLRHGNVQLFFLGWIADYPDPENFLFLFYGKNKKVGMDGENAANYQNPEFDRLFEKMREMEDGPERQAAIDRMVSILHVDAPWVFGYFPKTFQLSQGWVRAGKLHPIAKNTLKYGRLLPRERAQYQRQWNVPGVGWLWVMGLSLVGGVALVSGAYAKNQRRPGVKKIDRGR